MADYTFDDSDLEYVKCCVDTCPYEATQPLPHGYYKLRGEWGTHCHYHWYGKWRVLKDLNTDNDAD